MWHTVSALCHYQHASTRFGAETPNITARARLTNSMDQRLSVNTGHFALSPWMAALPDDLHNHVLHHKALQCVKLTLTVPMVHLKQNSAGVVLFEEKVTEGRHNSVAATATVCVRACSPWRPHEIPVNPVTWAEQPLWCLPCPSARDKENNSLL